MLDINNIPNQSGDNVKIYYAQSGSNYWQTWTKPRNCKYVWIMCMGGGAGGGIGTISTAGGGGGSGGVTKALFQANNLPDILFVQPGAQNPAGQSGNRSVVSIATNTTVMNLVCVSGATAAQPAGGAGETVATTANAAFLSLANFTSTPGITGGAGGAVVSTNPLISTITSCGQAGGNTNTSNGLSVPSIALGPYITPLIPGGAGTVGGNGGDGIFFWKPFYGLGGAGGGGTTSGVAFAGNGGDGAYGCGGGGGGVGPGGGGQGGRGGSGLVIIATF